MALIGWLPQIIPPPYDYTCEDVTKYAERKSNATVSTCSIAAEASRAAWVARGWRGGHALLQRAERPSHWSMRCWSMPWRQEWACGVFCARGLRPKVQAQPWQAGVQGAILGGSQAPRCQRTRALPPAGPRGAAVQECHGPQKGAAHHLPHHGEAPQRVVWARSRVRHPQEAHGRHGSKPCRAEASPGHTAHFVLWRSELCSPFLCCLHPRSPCSAVPSCTMRLAGCL